MKSFNQMIDRFCAKHPRFGIRNLMLFVVIGNAVVFLFDLMDTTGLLLNYLAFSPVRVMRGEVWRLFTFALIPSSSGIWILFFLYFYYFLGSTLERLWGTARFNLYFFSGILLTVLYGFITYFITGRSVGVTAYYLYLSMFLAFATFFPEQQVLLFGILPLKMKWLAWLDAAAILLGLFSDPFPANLLPVAALGNYLLYCGGILLTPLRRKKTKAQKQTYVNFHREMDRVNAERRAAPYRFRCDTCGRTDVSDPSLEFRYCSRCQGYHCFCTEHINKHVHFTE